MANPLPSRVLVLMLDGFGADYLDASDMPNLRRMMAAGFHATVDACMPTVTNVNNASICTGAWPAEHGITANSYLDLETREEHYMDRAELLLMPTLFERAAKAGRRSALLTAKVKTIRMLARGADLTLAAEAPDQSWVTRLGPPRGSTRRRSTTGSSTPPPRCSGRNPTSGSSTATRPTTPCT